MAEAEQSQDAIGLVSVPETLAAHYATVIKAIVDGRVVSFLGAGVNLWGRVPQAQ